MEKYTQWSAAVKFWRHHMKERNIALRYFNVEHRYVVNGYSCASVARARDYRKLYYEHKQASEMWLERCHKLAEQINK